MDCFFIPLIVPRGAQKCLILIVHFIFFFVAFAFIQEIIAKFNVIKLSPNRSFIYFELMFVYDVREGLFFDFGHVDIQFSKHHLLKTVFFPLHDFGTLVTPS